MMRAFAGNSGVALAAVAVPLILTISSAWSQTKPAPDIITTHRISASLASEIAAEVVASCARQGYAETAVVVDANGLPQALLRGDGAGAHSLDSANNKAYTAASFKTDTSKLAERAPKSPEFAALFTLPHLIPAGGGVVIKIGDETVGAVGAAGAPGFNLDEGCAQAGIEKVRDRLK
jgi:uncharacterized protein GlcG (DUF336 family)